ncbi:DNA-processing protein DprA [Ferrimonas gelatinilytica]|uniref:DNA-processing protein DprA n=1 Tax=Ferrimonas gelatinilytica TaxID=1255257 RepID=A0ABP9SDV0_9GAMM
MTHELSRYLALAGLRGIGLRRKLALLEAMPLDLIWQQAAQARVPGLSTYQCQQLLTPSENITSALAWYAEADDHHILTLADPRYPLALRAIEDPPLVLFVQGNLDSLNQPSIAMVGSRNAPPPSLDLAQEWAAQLAQMGLGVISGLAIGIDGASHRGALEHGQTVAVLGCGLRHCYPKRHDQLAAQIRKQGALVSEFWPQQTVRAQHFPQRNRIVSGLSYGVLVVAAAKRSGSLITARLAAEQGREVFAVPGSVRDPHAAGCHYLVQQGAKLVTSPVDLVEELCPQWQAEPPSVQPEVTSKLPHPGLLDSVGYETTPVDLVVQRSQLPVAEVLERLIELELDGWVQAVPGGYMRLRGR